MDQELQSITNRPGPANASIGFVDPQLAYKTLTTEYIAVGSRPPFDMI
jgi:hypothetical protein